MRLTSSAMGRIRNFVARTLMSRDQYNISLALSFIDKAGLTSKAKLIINPLRGEAPIIIPNLVVEFDNKRSIGFVYNHATSATEVSSKSEAYIEIQGIDGSTQFRNQKREWTKSVYVSPKDEEFIIETLQDVAASEPILELSSQ